MKTENNKKINTRIIKSDRLSEAAECIKSGGLVVFPTETVYGLGADALDAEAAKKIYAAKGRPSDNPLICHFTEAAQAEKYCETNLLFKKLADAFMPGPITVILPKKFVSGIPIIPAEVTGGLDSAAVRVPSNPVARELIRLSGVPIAAPSANLSGSPSPTSPRHVIEDMFGRVDYIIDGGDSEIGLESTIVLPEGEQKLRLLRPGAVTYEQLCEICPTEVDPAVYKKFGADVKPLAPGMKYRHYAPRSRVVILDSGTRDRDIEKAAYDFLKDKPRCAVLCYDEDERILSLPHAVSMGPRGDSLTQAHRLFSLLRETDGAETIYVLMPERGGVGLAVFNRLIKAAGYEIIKL